MNTISESKNTYPERVYEKGEVLQVQFYFSDGTPAQVDVLSITPNSDNDSNGAPTIVVPGFTEGITQDAKFGSYLCDATEAPVFVLGQYRRESKDVISSKEAITKQAETLLATVEKLGLTHDPVNIFANSLGAIVFARAAEIATERGWPCFKQSEGSRVVFMAPAGLRLDDHMLKVGKRFVVDNVLKAHLKEDDGWDKDSLKAGSGLIAQDPLKSAGEMIASARLQINFDELAKHDVTPYVLTSPRDGLMGQKALGASIIQLLEEGTLTSWSSPFAVTDENTPAAARPLSKKEASRQLFNSSAGAEHNTHMVNDAQAKRTAEAVSTLLNR